MHTQRMYLSKLNLILVQVGRRIKQPPPASRRRVSRHATLHEHAPDSECCATGARSQVLKHAWPHEWPDFIDEIVAASNATETLCENNMHILRLLRYVCAGRAGPLHRHRPALSASLEARDSSPSCAHTRVSLAAQ